MKTFFPDYNNCLSNLTNSILKYYGLKTHHKTLDKLDYILNEKEYKNIVLILYDGMGTNLLKRNLKEEDFLNRHKELDINAVFPPTTTASTTSILSGLNPNEHGWLGWDLYFKEINKVVTMFTNTLKDTEKVISEESISEKTYPYISILEAIKTKVNTIGLFPFKETLYTDIKDMNEKIIKTCQNNKKNFIYAYYENPDHIMHKTGNNSKQTKDTFKMINKESENLCKNLKDTLVIITADHGHINSEPITLKDYRDIFECLDRNTSIEARACSFKIKKGYEQKFKKLFNQYFSKDFNLYSKEEVIKLKLFGIGENNKNFEDSIGDFLAVATTNKYFRYDENSKKFLSQHAGITEDEVVVPIIIYRS